MLNDGYLIFRKSKNRN